MQQGTNRLMERIPLITRGRPSKPPAFEAACGTEHRTARKRLVVEDVLRTTSYDTEASCIIEALHHRSLLLSKPSKLSMPLADERKFAQIQLFLNEYAQNDFRGTSQCFQLQRKFNYFLMNMRKENFPRGFAVFWFPAHIR